MSLVEIMFNVLVAFSGPTQRPYYHDLPKVECIPYISVTNVEIHLLWADKTITCVRPQEPPNKTNLDRKYFWFHLEY